MKDYHRITQAFLQSGQLGVIYFREASTGREICKRVDHDEYLKYRAQGRIVRTGFLPWN